MCALFKQRNWEPEVVPELKASHGGLHVVLRNVSCLTDASTGKRKYPYPDFGSDLLAELMDGHLGNFERVRQSLSKGPGVSIEVRLRDLPAIAVEISGRAASEDEFNSGLADALIAAFESQGIRP